MTGRLHAAAAYATAAAAALVAIACDFVAGHVERAVRSHRPAPTSDDVADCERRIEEVNAMRWGPRFR